MAGDYRPRQDRTGQPLTRIECTGCGLSFETAARSHTNCPACRRNLRVGRATALRAARPGPGLAPVSGQAAVLRGVSLPPVRQEAPAVRLPETFRPARPAVLLPADDGGDGEIYIRDRRGRLVLARWDDSGRLVPVLRLPAGYLARELGVRGWYLRHHGQDICQIVRVWPAVAGHPAAEEPCARPAEHGGLCAKCFNSLRTPA